MKIGMFTEAYDPMINGVVHSIKNFKKGLEELGHEVFVFCPKYENYNGNPLDKNIIPVPSTPLPGKSGYYRIKNFDEKTIDIAKDLDVFHAQHPFFMGKKSLRLAQELKKPFLFTNHTQYEEYAHYFPFLSSLAKIYIRDFIKKFANNCNVVVAPAKGIKEILLFYGVTSRIEIVPNGIDTVKFNPKVRGIPKLLSHLKPHNKIAIFTGRTAKEKNLDFLFHAFQKVFQECPDTYLIVAGSGPEEGSFRQMILNLGLEGKIIMVGNVPYDEMPKYYGVADLFVTASTTEVHPLTILEAMATGLPAVAVDAPGTSDIISTGRDGILTPEDQDVFADKVIELLKNDSMNLLMKEQALKTGGRYSIMETSKRLLEVYQALLKN